MDLQELLETPMSLRLTQMFLLSVVGASVQRDPDFVDLVAKKLQNQLEAARQKPLSPETLSEMERFVDDVIPALRAFASHE